jgi:hypothetical protein
MEFAQRAFINDPYIVLAQTIMSLFFFSYATNVQPWLVLGQKKREREKLLIPMLCCSYKPKAEKYTDIVFSVYQLVFFPFYGDMMMMTHTHSSNRWLEGVHDREKKY